jgi:hypothetical protein
VFGFIFKFLCTDIWVRLHSEMCIGRSSAFHSTCGTQDKLFAYLYYSINLFFSHISVACTSSEYIYIYIFIYLFIYFSI